jgi:hypothetical protein
LYLIDGDLRGFTDDFEDDDGDDSEHNDDNEADHESISVDLPGKIAQMFFGPILDSGYRFKVVSVSFMLS